MLHVHTHAIQNILKEERKEGFDDGIRNGYQVAERILRWWSSNHELKEPHSNEKLEKWSQDALAELRAKLS